ncbi:MAG: type III-B CRISPR module RAMP protein Cmr6 [Thermus sp.]
MGRREALRRVRLDPQGTHRGLWLDKYLAEAKREDTEAKGKLVKEVAGIAEPQEYGAFFDRYLEALRSVGAETRAATARSRLAVGLGGEGVLETSLTLHRTYGVPYIPGSALKGLASRYAHLYLEGEAWRRNLGAFARGEAQAGLFGTTEEQGAVVFFDALPYPKTWKIHPDIMNPHHAGYYGGGETPPADWDSPVPVPFLSVTGTFLLALAPAPGVPREEARPWLQAAWRILAWALREEGVGAKTASGYGRLELEEAPTPPPPQAVSSPAYEALRTQLRSTRYRDLPAFLEREAQTILGLSPQELQGLKEAMEERKFLQNAADLKAWAKRSETVRQVLQKLGVL